MNNAFVYKWTHIPSLKWYIGFHSGKNKKYICSSKLIKEHIINNPLEWRRDIISVGSMSEMYELETEILQLLDAKNDVRSFNGHNNDAKGFNTLNRTKEFMSVRERKRRSLVHKGKPKSDIHKAKLSNALKGRPNPRLASTHGKGIPKVKNVCRICDKKEMNLSHFVQWCNKNRK